MAGDSPPAGIPKWWNKLLGSISGSMVLPPDVVLDVVRTTLIGTMQLHVENHKGVLEYTPEKVRIRTWDGATTARGARLKIGSIYRDEIVVEGRIDGLEIERGRSARDRDGESGSGS